MADPVGKDLQDEAASPQLENGYAPLAKEILRALQRTRLPRAETSWPLLMHVFDQTYGEPDWERRAAGHKFANRTSFITTRGAIFRAIRGSRRASDYALKELADQCVLIINHLGMAGNARQISVRFNKNYLEWKGFFGTENKRAQSENKRAQTENKAPGLRTNVLGKGGDREQTCSVLRTNVLSPDGNQQSSQPVADPSYKDQTSSKPERTRMGEGALSGFRENWERAREIADQVGYPEFGDLEFQWGATGLPICQSFVRKSEERLRFAFQEFVKLRQDKTAAGQLQFLPTSLTGVIAKLSGFAGAYVETAEMSNEAKAMAWLNSDDKEWTA